MEKEKEKLNENTETSEKSKNDFFLKWNRLEPEPVGTGTG